ncbi:hypothetical protein ACN4EE_03830 [Geminocystis sp. CENA526]|uniref:hypothetical protein n=1 Tax=Geminocystis sp. CENA526 TaxID=1355871 RepID=UPI003D6E096A
MNNLKPKIGLKNNLDKLLFVSATIYLMSVLAWFWKQHPQTTSSFPVIKDNPQSENNDTSPLNQENIPLTDNPINLLPVNNNTTPSQTLIPPIPLPSLPSGISSDNLAIPPLPNSQVSLNPPEVSLLPIPQPPQPTLPPPPPLPVINNNPVNSSPSSASPSKIPPPPPPQKLTKVPVISSPNNNSISLPNNQNNNTISIVPSPPETASETNYNYTLQGVVELGNTNSIALFKVNNITEKVSIGAEIGTTGWVLMGIHDRQAVISRNNESVYLRVGETF